jgi:flagellar assembly protein FliH
MSSSTKVYQKFDFGMQYNKAGEGESTRPVSKRAYKPEEVEAIREEAYQLGKRDVEAQAKVLESKALEALAQATHAGLSTLRDAVFTHKTQSVQLCLAIAQKLSNEALAYAPHIPLEMALANLSKELEQAPRLTLFAPSWPEGLTELAREAAKFAGYEGAITFRERPNTPQGSFEIVWHEGRAEFNPATIATALMHDLNEALASEAYHKDHPDTHEPQDTLPS